jgi:hypothetical protein
MAVLKLPVSLLNRAKAPLAVFWVPVSLSSSAAVPLAVFSVPVVLKKSAAAPVAVFESAVLRSSAPAPTAVLKLRVVTVLSSESRGWWGQGWAQVFARLSACRRATRQIATGKEL